MKKFCVSYDLISPIGSDRKKDYDLIEEKLAELSESSKLSKTERIQESVWILTLNNFWDCRLLKDEFMPCFRKQDRIFIALIDETDNYVAINRYRKGQRR